MEAITANQLLLHKMVPNVDRIDSLDDNEDLMNQKDKTSNISNLLH